MSRMRAAGICKGSRFLEGEGDGLGLGLGLEGLGQIRVRFGLKEFGLAD